MGQLQSVSVLEPQRTLAVEETAFNPQTALPVQHSSFGRVLRTMSYHPNGLLWELRDGAGNPTRFENYKLGQPQVARFADGTSASQTINTLGNAQDFTNEAGQRMSFGFDAMGRVNRVSYPAEPGMAYHDTTITLQRSAQADRGLPAGHWRQTVQTGNEHGGEVIDRWLDGLWRVRLEWRRDSTMPNTSGRMVETRYDAAGNKTFESYPQRQIPQVDSHHPGTSHSYDPLQRRVRTEADSELGSLVTRVDYLAGFRKQVTNPRGLITTYQFQAFDQPSEDSISLLQLPEGAEVQFVRDVFGKPRFINRYGPSSSGNIAVTREYAYNEYQQLCKTVEPESGATVQGYDDAGNVSWRATGRPQSSSCNRAEQPTNRLTLFTHDERNRLRFTSFGDGSPQIERRYTPDGLLDQISSGQTRWNYTYNNRRILTSETLIDTGVSNQPFTLNWMIDHYGHRAAMTYPGGIPLQFFPNALGQPQRLVSGEFLLAGEVSYHPNGAIAGYVLSNGIRHVQEQNVRGIPRTWIDATEATNFVNHTYAYDESGNVTSISDGALPSQSRWMSYDGLDRLRTAHGAWGSAEYRYDAVDNLRYSQVGARTFVHGYDSRNLLVQLTQPGGSIAASLSYDANGNVSTRGSQSFSFDIGNRLQSSNAGLSFSYDGHGRRTRVDYPGQARRLQMFSQDGKLMYGLYSANSPVPLNEPTLYVYLQDRLIGEYRIPNGVGVLQYVHTDALGSPVVKTTDEHPPNTVTASRRWHEPYGQVAPADSPSGVGYTGHFYDSETGLVYMQQRYYDPLAGRFLSVDPVTTNAKDGSFFGRYHYASNNPYRFLDPDGRLPIAVVALWILREAGAEVFEQVTGVPAPSIKNLGKGAAEKLVGAALKGRTPVPGVYTFKEEGKEYVGQSKDQLNRLTQHATKGRLQEAEVKSLKSERVDGGKLEREKVEQQKINEATRGEGAPHDNVSNKVNPCVREGCK